MCERTPTSLVIASAASHWTVVAVHSFHSWFRAPTFCWLCQAGTHSFTRGLGLAYSIILMLSDVSGRRHMGSWMVAVHGATHVLSILVLYIIRCSNANTKYHYLLYESRNGSQSGKPACFTSNQIYPFCKRVKSKSASDACNQYISRWWQGVS